MMGSLPLPDLTTPGRGHLPGSRRYRWQGHHGGVRRPHHPDQTYKDRVLGPGGRLPGSFGRLIRTPSGQIRTRHHPVLPVVLIPPCPRWSWSTAMSLALLGHLSRRQVPHGGKVGALSGHRRQIGRLVRVPPCRGSGQCIRSRVWCSGAARRASYEIDFVQHPRRQRPPLATLERGQAVYPPPDGQRTADLNPAGAEVPT